MKVFMQKAALLVLSAFLGVMVSITVNAAGEVTTPIAPLETTQDVALPSTETPLVPKGLIEDMKKEPLQESSPATSVPAKQAPAVTPLTPIPEVAQKPETDKPVAQDQAEEKKAVAKKDAKTPTAVGRVIWVKGVMTAEHKDRKTRKLDKQSIIFVGDTLVTDAKTQAQVAFTDTTLMTFRPNTKFVIAEYSYHPKEKDEKGSVGKFVMDLVAGGFRTITGLIPKSNKDDYEVKTPVATIGVRGTDYSVYVGGNKQVILGQIAGIPTLTTATGQTTELTGENRYATVSPDGSITLSFERPAILDVNLPIVPATVEPITPSEAVGSFGADSGGGGGEWCIM